MPTANEYIDTLLAIPVNQLFTYRVNPLHHNLIQKGHIVLVPRGKTGTQPALVLHKYIDTIKNPSDFKETISLIDTVSVSEITYTFWKWIATYYLSVPGLVFKMSFPFSTKLKSIKERKKYIIQYIQITEKLRNEKSLHNILNSLKRSVHQYNVMNEIIRLYITGTITINIKDLILTIPNASYAIKQLLKKQILKEININTENSLSQKSNKLSELSKQLTSLFSYNLPILYVYNDKPDYLALSQLIQSTVISGKQAIILSPTTELLMSHYKYFSDYLTSNQQLYSPLVNPLKRQKIWFEASYKNSTSIYFGTRTALLLPFQNTGLIIITDEHDANHKTDIHQPNYNLRDCAIYYATLSGAKILLMSNTPSVESIYNVNQKKYILANFSSSIKENQLKLMFSNLFPKTRQHPLFTDDLIIKIKETLISGKQVLLFQNHKGYSKYIQCKECGWTPTCKNCSVTLTYYQEKNILKCRFCNYTEPTIKSCIKCSSTGITAIDPGTEQVSSEIKLIFPEYTTAYLDKELKIATRKDIIKRFNNNNIHILTGTQILIDNIEHKNVGLVALLKSDVIFNQPDFRSYERALQFLYRFASKLTNNTILFFQVYNFNHIIYKLFRTHTYIEAINIITDDRKKWGYPPFSKLIFLSIQHQSEKDLEKYSQELYNRLNKIKNIIVFEPVQNYIYKIRKFYIKNIMIKMNKHLQNKNHINQIIHEFSSISHCTVIINVDP